MKYTLVKKTLPQNPQVEVLVPNYKEPILPVNHGGAGWYGLQSYEVLYDEVGNPYPGKLLCHECGEFSNSLGNHIRSHGITGREYKEKYMLEVKTKLVSLTTRDKSRIAYHSHSTEWHEASCERLRMGRLLIRRPSHRYTSLETLNKYNTCLTQTLARLAQIIKERAPEITKRQLEAIDPNLMHAIRARCGSLNKAKQMLNLAGNARSEPKYEKLLILEDMVSFYRVQNRWPCEKDYRKRLMRCSESPIRSNGGFRKLRVEAEQLKEEQDKRPSQKDVALAANRIEMEYAGMARR